MAVSEGSGEGVGDEVMGGSGVDVCEAVLVGVLDLVAVGVCVLVLV